MDAKLDSKTHLQNTFQIYFGSGAGRIRKDFSRILSSVFYPKCYEYIPATSTFFVSTNSNRWLPVFRQNPAFQKGGCACFLQLSAYHLVCLINQPSVSSIARPIIKNSSHDARRLKSCFSSPRCCTVSCSGSVKRSV